jgi:hypothetical protein
MSSYTVDEDVQTTWLALERHICMYHLPYAGCHVLFVYAILPKSICTLLTTYIEVKKSCLMSQR